MTPFRVPTRTSLAPGCIDELADALGRFDACTVLLARGRGISLEDAASGKNNQGRKT